MSLADMFSKMFSKGGAGGGTPSTLIPGLKSGKTRQYAVLGVLGGALYLGLYLIFATSADNKPKQQMVDQQKVMTTHIAAAGEAVDPRERWIGTAGNKVAEHDARLAQQEQATKELMAKFNAVQDAIQKNSAASSAHAAQPPATATTTSTATASSSTVPPIAKVLTQTITPPAKFPPGTPTSAAQGVTLPPPVGSKGEAYDSEPVIEIGHVHLTGSGSGSGKAGTQAPAGGKVQPAGAGAVPVGGKNEAERMVGTTFLPVGFVKSTLLGGIDAPTGGQAQSNPLPVFFRLKDLAVLPNEFRANVRDCMVVGAAYGDLSAERAYVRIELLSCIRNDGKTLEVKASGVVYGEDGKLGIRGRVVTKQGQVLGNSLLAGVVGGIGQGIQYQSSTTTVTPVGSAVTQPNAGQEMRSGISGGVGHALDRLANYYISLAEKLFPVIEVDSNRDVDVAFTKGTELSVPLPELANAGGSDDE